MEIFTEINKTIDLARLNDDVSNIIRHAGWKMNQISLQYADKVDWHSGIGKSDMLASDEQSYKNFHPFLKNMYIYELLNSFDFPVSHTRIMNLPAKTCYTTHVDYYTRYHIPVKSKPLQTFMIFPDKNVFLRMYPGNVYWTNTHELHNFVNGTLEDRIHIVFNNALEKKNLDNLYLSM
jgi:hypothetical protein